MGGVVRAYPMAVRLENAAVSYVRYLGHAIWPVNLAFFYPHVSAFQAVWLESLFILIVITALSVVRTDRPYLAVGWLWFLGTLVPMIGLVRVGGQAMADRYGYLSFVGLFIMLCWGIADLAENWQFPRVGFAAACAVVLIGLAFATHRQVGYWSSDVALWAHTAEATDNNSGAENVLGETLQKAGQPEQAMTHFRIAAAMDPLLPFPRYHLAVYDQQHGALRSALAQFQRVLELTQADTGIVAELRSNTLMRMAAIYEALGETAQAHQSMGLAVEEHQRAQQFMRPSAMAAQ
jgi:tetratricopeptide (TPR) repeat protein